MFRLLIRDHHVVGRVDVEHRHQVGAAILALAKVEIDAAGVAEILDRGPRSIVTAAVPSGRSESRHGKEIMTYQPNQGQAGEEQARERPALGVSALLGRHAPARERGRKQPKDDQPERPVHDTSRSADQTTPRSARKRNRCGGSPLSGAAPRRAKS